MDNDPPCAHLPELVAAWNQLGLSPRLQISTPSGFLSALRNEWAGGSPAPQTVRGDWADWWMDGIASTPGEVKANQQAKRTLVDLGALSKLLKVPVDDSLVGRAWDNSLLFDEHTWGAYNSVAEPYSDNTIGQFAEKSALAYRALCISKQATKKLVSGSHRFKAFSMTKSLVVCNPGTGRRSGWINIPHSAIRFPANMVEDLETGRRIPLEILEGPVWSIPEKPPSVYEIPSDVWQFQPTFARFFVENLPGGSIRKFRLLFAKKTKLPTLPRTSTSLRVDWAKGTPAPRQISLTQSKVNLVDTASRFRFGQILVEQGTHFASRHQVSSRRCDESGYKLRQSTPRLMSSKSSPFANGLRHELEFSHRAFHRAEQTWNFFSHVKRVDVETTLWVPETVAPIAVYLCFPFALTDAEMSYFSCGTETRFPADVMPGTCADFVCVNHGVQIRSGECPVVIATPDNPLGCWGRPSLRVAKNPLENASPSYFSILFNNYWDTNFSVIKERKLTFRHRLLFEEDAEPGVTDGASDLMAFPCD
ncbi:MAG: hypothetical protein WEB60_03320 [Terrimicrobiaceae bacterium]